MEPRTEIPAVKLPAALQSALWATRPDLLLARCRQRFGDTFTLRFAGLGDVLFVSAPEDVRAVFTAPPSVVLAGRGNAFLRAVVGRHSLLTLDGEAHVRQRKLLVPPFHGERIATYAKVIVEATERSLARWPREGAFETLREMQAITLEVIVRAVLGVEDPSERRRFEALFNDFAAIGNSAALLLPPLRVDLGPRSPWGRVLAVRARTDQALFRELDRRRALAASAPETEGARRDVLALLLSARDDQGQAMSDRELRDELVTLLLAGHETTATSLAWTMDLLSKHPEVLAKARDEVSRVVGRESPDASAIAKLPYLDGVVRESLRLRPVIPNVARIIEGELHVAGATLRTGAGVAPCAWLTHTRPENWPAPNAFDPERWTRDKIDPHAFYPFGGGARRCIGMAFALYEMKTILATVLAKRTFVAREGEGARVARRGITLTPSGDGRVTLTAPT
ncbi:MAG: cytochrome P450 [Myxococcales bacterium]|nr:cytochrome P450 [Myxococcales bacterium]